MAYLKCGCGKAWEYKGKNNVYATCPDCHRMVRICDSPTMIKAKVVKIDGKNMIELPPDLAKYDELEIDRVIDGRKRGLYLISKPLDNLIKEGKT